MKHLAAIAAAAILSITAVTGGAAQQRRAAQTAHETQARLRREARVSEARARATALAAVPHGRVRSSELEREHGRLIWSFDIAVPGRSGIEEVNVSAADGRIVAHEHEGPAAERREARQEAAEHRHPR